MPSKLISAIFAIAVFAACGSSIAQTSRGLLQEEGIEPPLEQIFWDPSADTTDPRFVRAFRQAVEASTKREMNAPSRLNDLLAKHYGQVSPAKAKLLERNIRAILNHDGYYDLLVNLTLPMVQAKVPMSRIKEVMESSMLEVPLKGLPRLSEQDQMGFIAYMARLIVNIPPEMCKRIALNEMSARESAFIERGYLVSRSDQEFKIVLDLYLRASEAELSDSPGVPKYTDAQMQSAQSVFAEGLISRMSKRMSIENVSRILNDMGKASANEACDASMDILRTLLDMPAPFRKWQLQAFVNESSR